MLLDSPIVTNLESRAKGIRSTANAAIPCESTFAEFAFCVNWNLRDVGFVNAANPGPAGFAISRIQSNP